MFDIFQGRRTRGDLEDKNDELIFDLFLLRFLWDEWKQLKSGQHYCGIWSLRDVHLICNVKIQRSKWFYNALTWDSWLKMQVWLRHKTLNSALHQISQLMSGLWCSTLNVLLSFHLPAQSYILWEPSITYHPLTRRSPIHKEVTTFLSTSWKSPQHLYPDLLEV